MPLEKKAIDLLSHKCEYIFGTLQIVTDSLYIFIELERLQFEGALTVQSS